jgi:hypothetical protein
MAVGVRTANERKTIPMTKNAKALTPKAEQRRPTKTIKLRFSPYAWAKLLFLRDLGSTEVGGFGISAADDLTLIEDVLLIRQCCTAVMVRFDDQSVADYFDSQVDRGLKPERFARIWLHTHPGNSAEPTATDEETFARSFGNSDWAVMFILSRGGQTTAQLQYNIGPGISLALPVEVDFGCHFPAADQQAWREEYARCVFEEPTPVEPKSQSLSTGPDSRVPPNEDPDSPWWNVDRDAPWWWDDYWHEQAQRADSQRREDEDARDYQPF